MMRTRFAVLVVLALLSTTCMVARPSLAAEESPNAYALEAGTENALTEIMATPNRFERNAALYRFVADADRPRIEALLGAVVAMPGRPQRDDVVRVLYIRFASLQPAAAVAHALRNHDKPQVLEAVFRAWAHVDLEAAVARASSLSTVMKQDAARAILDLDLTSAERTAIAEQLAVRPNFVEIEQVAPPPAAEPYDRALARIAAIDDATARYREIASVTAAWAAEDAAGALAAILDWSGDKDLKNLWLSQVMEAWADADPRAAVDWLLTREPEGVASLLGPAFGALAKVDLAEAEALVAALPEGTARLEAQLSVFAVMLDEDNLDRAFAAFRELDPRGQQRLAMSLGKRLAQEDPESAFAWAMELDEPVRSNTLPFLLGSIHRADAGVAKRLVEGIDDTATRIHTAAGLFHQGLQGAEPSETLRWLTTLGTEAETEPLVARVFVVWSATDEPAATAAVMEYPPGAVRDRLLLAMVSYRMRIFDMDAAERLLDAIDSPTEKAKAEARLRALRDNEDGSDVP